MIDIRRMTNSCDDFTEVQTLPGEDDFIGNGDDNIVGVTDDIVNAVDDDVEAIFDVDDGDDMVEATVVLTVVEVDGDDNSDDDGRAVNQSSESPAIITRFKYAIMTYLILTLLSSVVIFTQCLIKHVEYFHAN
jgi:hypothetical protein